MLHRENRESDYELVTFDLNYGLWHLDTDTDPACEELVSKN